MFSSVRDWLRGYTKQEFENWKEMVEIPGKKYAIGKYQVTQAVWSSVMRRNPSEFLFLCQPRPVERVCWLHCVFFCNKLSEKEGLKKVYTLPEGVEKALIQQKIPRTGSDRRIKKLGESVSQNLEANGYRLPTDWEWCFAAKANDEFEYSGSDNPDEVAWYHENSKGAWYHQNSNGETHGVGQKKPNGFGLYDMSGNVWEWCWDWGNSDTNTRDWIPTENSTGPSTESLRVLRGGGWANRSYDFRVSRQLSLNPSLVRNDVGFRLARTIR